MSDKVEKFMTSMTLAFGTPMRVQGKEIEWFQMWERVLKHFEPWVVEAAVQDMIDNRTDRSFPQPGEVKKVCQEVKRRENAGKPQLDVRQGPQDDPFSLADALINCNMGREAARANPSWVLALHDFCRENGRLPTGPEITKCKRIAHDSEQIEHAIAIGKVSLTPTTKRGREALHSRRERLRRRLLGEEADQPTKSTFVPDHEWVDRERALYRSRMPEAHRLASEWMDKICAEYGSFEQWHKVKRPPGSPFQNKRRGGAE